MAEQSIIEQRLNLLTGNAEWVVIKSNIEEEDGRGGGGGGGGAGSLAHTKYLDMLNDGPRNRAYEEAIRKVVKQGDHVLDIGAGTGLLSMMAWRALNAEHCRSSDTSNNDDGVATPVTTSGRVTACESYLPMVRLARKVLRSNGIGRGVLLIHKRSDDLQIGSDMSSLADVLVSEILDSELLGEGLIPTLRHAHANLLKPNPRSVPHRATVYGQLIECSYLWHCNDLKGVEEDVGDGLILASAVLEGREYGSSRPMNIDVLADQLRLISEPFEVFTFEFTKSPADKREREIEVTVTRDGSVHALVSWWVLQLDEDGEIIYSTAPGWIQMSSWRDHWKQCVWSFPGKGTKVCCGDVVVVNATHDEISIKYAIRSPRDGRTVMKGDGGHRSHLLARPERIGFLGDKANRGIFKEAIRKALEGKSSRVCLVVDDSVLCALTAGVHPNADVVAMLPGFQHGGSTLMKSIAEGNGVGYGRIHVLGKKAAQLGAEDLKGRKVEVLIAEPYYRAYEDLLPWRHLRFWYERTSLAPLLADHPTIIPCEGILRGVAVFLPDLWNSRKALTSVEGFDHSEVNQELGACGKLPSFVEGPLLPYSLWQCGQYKELSDPFSIMTFDFSLPLQAVKGLVRVPVQSSGLCHGIALWMDWVMESQNKTVLSTGPRVDKLDYWTQGIKLLSSPLQLQSSTSDEEMSKKENSSEALEPYRELTISAAFNPSTGDIGVDLSTTPSQLL